MTAVPLPVLTDLGALNAHARHHRACAERNAIYAYKEAATWQLLHAGEAAVRPVKWRGPCGKCDATGTFTFWDDGVEIQLVCHEEMMTKNGTALGATEIGYVYLRGLPPLRKD